MKITNLSVQQKNPDRVNLSVDGKYSLSLDILQVTELGLKVGQEIAEAELAELEQESEFGKLYAKALDYTLMRPHSAKEVRDYLWRKTNTTKYKSRKTGEIKERPGVSQSIADRVYERLLDRGYINDVKFAEYWVENRNQTKGTSLRKIVNELRAKGVSSDIIDQAISRSDRNDGDELHKIIAKKRRRYPDEEKFIAYLLRQGFRYDDVRSALSDSIQAQAESDY